MSGDLIVSSLGSGSNGNAFLVEFGSDRILIDAGVPIRTLTACLAQRSITPGDLRAALISHEHSDHTRALLQLIKKAPIPLFATHGTLCGMPEVQRCEQHEIRSLSSFGLGGLTITPIPVAHDARDPVGFFIECELASVAIMTDLGEATEVNAEFACRADHLIIESNYDESMLRSGPYPAHLKQRIRSRDGHLGNEECAAFLRDIGGGRTGEIWLCHLSENNNRPELAVRASTECLTSAGIVQEVTALPRYDGRVTTWYSSQKRTSITQSSLPF